MSQGTGNTHFKNSRGRKTRLPSKKAREEARGRPEGKTEPTPGLSGLQARPHGGCRRAWDASTAAPSPLPGVKSCADVLLLLNVTFTRYLRVRGNLHKTRVNASFLSPLLTLHSKAPKTDLLLQPALRLPPLREAFKLLTVSLTAL